MDSPNDPNRTKILSNMFIYYRSIQDIEFTGYLKSLVTRFKSNKKHKLLEKSVMKI